MNMRELAIYEGLRLKGMRPGHAKHSAQTQHIFEWLEYHNIARLQWLPDDYCSYDNLAGDVYNLEINEDSVPGGKRAILAQEKEFKRMIDQDRVWGLVGQIKCHECDEWKNVDSVWGFVGQEAHFYEFDVMAECVRKIKSRKEIAYA